MKKSAAPQAGARPSVHVSIDVPDLEAGLRFYGEVFGKSSSTGADKRRYERHWTPIHLDLHVADFDAALDKVRARGGAIENEYRTHGPRPAAFCSDPFGNGFCVIGETAGPP